LAAHFEAMFGRPTGRFDFLASRPVPPTQSQAVPQAVSEGGHRHETALDSFYRAEHRRKSSWGPAGASFEPIWGRPGPGENKTKLDDFQFPSTPNLKTILTAMELTQGPTQGFTHMTPGGPAGRSPTKNSSPKVLRGSWGAEDPQPKGVRGAGPPRKILRGL